MVTDYELLDCGDFQKYEKVGPYFFIRPSPQAVWPPKNPVSEWNKKVDAVYKRYSEGKGEWFIKNPKLQDSFIIQVGNCKYNMKLTSFGHLGLFFEQSQMWVEISSRASKSKVLNLFAYTGGLTCHLLKAGAEVVHLDASKTSVQWAKENAQTSQVADKKVRWIVDDVQKFVEKEVRRGSVYDAVVLDPPSYGRGQKNEVWKIEEHLIPLLYNIKKILNPDFHFIQLSCHSQGYTPIALSNLLHRVFEIPQSREIVCEEMIVKTKNSINLPSGAQCYIYKK